MPICVLSIVFCVFPACQILGEFNRFLDFLTHRADIVQIIDSCFRYFCLLSGIGKSTAWSK